MVSEFSGKAFSHPSLFTETRGLTVLYLLFIVLPSIKQIESLQSIRRGLEFLSPFLSARASRLFSPQS